MARTLTFHIRINQEERDTLEVLAKHLHRSMGDTVRFLITIALDEVKKDGGSVTFPLDALRFHSHVTKSDKK